MVRLITNEFYFFNKYNLKYLFDKTYNLATSLFHGRLVRLADNFGQIRR